MITVIISHEVQNFAEWKVGFDANKSFREGNGVIDISLYTSIDNPNLVTFIYEAASAELVNGMMSNPDFIVTMKAAGVIGRPTISMLNKV